MKRSGGGSGLRTGKRRATGAEDDDSAALVPVDGDGDVRVDAEAAAGAAAGAGGPVLDIVTSPKIAKAPFNDDLLQLYYKWFFPYSQMYRWLSYGVTGAAAGAGAGGKNKDILKHREFSFTKDDMYMRYISFADEKSMRKTVMERSPHKIDIGAVYTASPERHDAMTKEAFRPVQRELVFDIDLTDYDCVRTCCSDADICERCWQYMNVAVKVMDTGLREDFGYEHMLWVYSGRRGIHCWVCDEEARMLNNQERGAIVEYFSAIQGGSEKNAQSQVPLTDPLHPSFQRALDVLHPFFEDFIIQPQGQRLLVDEDKFSKVLDLLPPAPVELRDTVAESWANKDMTASRRWRVLVNEVQRCMDAFSKQAQKRPSKDIQGYIRALRRCVPSIIFTHTYPRLDVNVSKGMNHLLKSPFCVHPKTGRVCVPIDPAHVDDFNPAKVPSVDDLQRELNDAPDTSCAFTHTSMKQPVAVMEAFLKSMERKAREAARHDRELIAGMSNDW